MSHLSETRLLVLHSLRRKGLALPEAVAESAQVELEQADRWLSELAESGLAVHREGRVSGWALTAAGRSENERLLVEELELTGARGALESLYERFLDRNGVLLGLCTAWQLRGEAPNDHSDAGYDAEVMSRLVSFHDGARPICADLRELLARFSPYGTRLRSALEKALGGDHDWLTKPLIDSYHTVWFELHEDLLATLGIERASEARSV